MNNFLVFLAAFFSCAVLIQCSCNIDYYAVGCYKDNTQHRAMSNELLNERDPSNPNHNGHTIDWHNWNQYMKELACRCAQATRNAQKTVFGLQFYGECWSLGPDEPENSYSSIGAAAWDMCVGNDYQNCTRTCQHCVGKASTNFVYRLGESDYY